MRGWTKRRDSKIAYSEIYSW